MTHPVFTKLWTPQRSGKGANMAWLELLIGLMHFVCLQFARNPGDVGRLIVLTINSCKAWHVSFGGILHSCDIHHFKAQISQIPLEECARSAAERGISLSTACFTKQASTYEELNAKNPDLCYFSQLNFLQSNQFAHTEVCRTNSQACTEFKTSENYFESNPFGYFFIIQRFT